MDFEEILENPAFWILGGLGVSAEVIGFIVSKRSETLPSFPIWQFALLIFGTLVAAAVFANRG